MTQHSSMDAVTEWVCLGLSMAEDDAGLNDDDNPSQEEVDASLNEAIEDEWRGGPRQQRLRSPRLDQERRGEDSSARDR